jgi:hypothetical protein
VLAASVGVLRFAVPAIRTGDRLRCRAHRVTPCDGLFHLLPMLTDGVRGVHRPIVLVFGTNSPLDSCAFRSNHYTAPDRYDRTYPLARLASKRWLEMMVVFAIFLALLGGPNVSFDGVSGGPSLLGGSPPAFDGVSGGPSFQVAPPTSFDGVSGGPSVTGRPAPPPPATPPSHTMYDGVSGGPSITGIH